MNPPPPPVDSTAQGPLCATDGSPLRRESTPHAGPLATGELERVSSDKGRAATLSPLGEALRYAEHFPILPIRERAKEPFGGTRGVLDATQDRNTLREWWLRHPNANIGLATGAVSGIFVLDIDGTEGEASLAALEHEHGPLPVTRICLTGREGGGRHLYFVQPPGVQIANSAGQLGPGLDVKGDGGYVILPPSVHPSGLHYRWGDE